MGDGVTFAISDSYRGEGVSLGLPRGLTVSLDARNITQEGMGLGTIACRRGGFTWFARHSRTVTASANHYRTWFLLDCRLLWGFGTWRPLWLSRFLEGAAILYMRVPRAQAPVMGAASRLRTLLGLTAEFARGPAGAEAVFDYRVHGDTVEVSCRITPLRPGISRYFIMNELGADHFRLGLSRQGPIAPPSGWQPLPTRFPTRCLLDPDHGLGFQIDGVSVWPGDPMQVFWGRERFAQYCWAGFELVVRPRRRAMRPVTLVYSLSVRRKTWPGSH